MAKDFFDEEYEKQVQTTEDQREQNFDSWYSRPAPEQAQSKNKKSLYITLICVALVACIAFGWFLCTIFQGIGGSNAASEGGEILNTVIEYLKNNYYKDISEDQWIQAIELSGTMLMQSAGDRFSMLMSPQTYYEFNCPTATVGGNSGVFGVSFLIEEGIGLYVSDVSANSSAYGKLKEGDFVLKLSNVKARNGETPTIAGYVFDEIVLSQWASATIESVLGKTHSATFHVLRENESNPNGYEILTFDLERSVIPTVNSNYQYEFIEFYFDSEHTNISTEPLGNAEISTYDERNLAALPEGTGYVRIIQFMDYVKVDNFGNVIVDGDGNPVTVSASDEFLEVMQLFGELELDRLVLDLKGNPGGNVRYVSEIAGMLVTDAKLTDAQKNSVTNRNGELLITYLEIPKPVKITQSEYLPSTYNDYFGTPSGKCDIVVWTDGNSASASELLTGALLDYDTAVQMGTTTYGKGIAQTWEELPFTEKITVNGRQIEYPWAIYYTCAMYYSPLGNNIHGIGYKPKNGVDGYVYSNRSSYADLWEAANHYWNA